MKKKNTPKALFPLIGFAVRNLLDNKIIFYPFVVLGFIQLLILEILYFSPRFPLNVFFGPFIKYFYGVKFLHYPLNLSIIPTLYYHDVFQPIFHIFISSLFVSRAIAIIHAVNSGEEVKTRKIFRKSWSYYIHVVVASALSFFMVKGLFMVYEMIYARAQIIRSTTGIYAWIKYTVIYGAPYFNLLLSVLGTTLFIYMLPVIVIEKVNVFKALFKNVKMLIGSFFFTYFVLLIPSLLYIPVLLLRNSFAFQTTFPEATVIILGLSIIIMLFIDAIIYSAITTYYLLKKEEK